MRILAYAQLLQSYSSLTLESLAHAFGVTVDFVDKCAILPESAIRNSRVFFTANCHGLLLLGDCMPPLTVYMAS
jgi:hypothetical protein